MEQVASALDGRRFGQGIAHAGLFFRRWMAHPMQMGAIVPSGRSLCRKVAACARAAPDEAIVELGAGTGVVTRELLRGAVSPDRLFVVEIARGLADHLRAGLPPAAHVIEGDARLLPALIPPAWHGRIGTVVVGIPLAVLPFADQRRFVDAIEAVAPGRGFILYTYYPRSPLPWRELGLRVRREAWTLFNLPPASVFRYTPR